VVGPWWLVAKGKRGKGFLLRCFNQAGFAAASRGSNFHFSEPRPDKPCTNVFVYFPPFLSLSLFLFLFLSERLSRVRQLGIYTCVCPALKRYPRFTGTRDPDPVRLLKKLRDRKGLRYVETKLAGLLQDALYRRGEVYSPAMMINFIYLIVCLIFLPYIAFVSLLRYKSIIKR
jgi:hypothetical protein